MLGSLLVPSLIVAQQSNADVSIYLQVGLIAVASYLCQLLRRKPFAELLGNLNGHWLRELVTGGFAGGALMLIPALLLGLLGWVHWEWIPAGVPALWEGAFLLFGAALAEELLFRGFIFQRLVAGLGPWPAQLLLGGFFLLTHLNNPGMTGSVRVLAGMNIFLASLLFGFAFIRTQSLAMPLGLHFMANWVQGSVLGFGVSGTEQLGVLKPVFAGVPDWITGGSFGLEASIPGLVCVLVTLILMYRRKPRQGGAAVQ